MVKVMPSCQPHYAQNGLISIKDLKKKKKKGKKEKKKIRVQESIAITNLEHKAQSHYFITLNS